MKFVLVRNTFLDDTTLGTLLLERDGYSEYVCETLEDKDRHLEGHPEEKVNGRSAIPRGIYEVAFTHSPRFGRQMLELLDVPGFTGIRVHAGNEAADTEGCILVGLTRHKRSIGRSRDAVAKVEGLAHEAFAQLEEVTMEIK